MLSKCDLQQMHLEYNQKYFEGRLSVPTLKWLTCRLPYSRYIEANNLIQI